MKSISLSVKLLVLCSISWLLHVFCHHVRGGSVYLQSHFFQFSSACFDPYGQTGNDLTSFSSSFLLGDSAVGCFSHQSHFLNFSVCESKMLLCWMSLKPPANIFTFFHFYTFCHFKELKILRILLKLCHVWIQSSTLLRSGHKMMLKLRFLYSDTSK